MLTFEMENWRPAWHKLLSSFHPFDSWTCQSQLTAFSPRKTNPCFGNKLSSLIIVRKLGFRPSTDFSSRSSASFGGHRRFCYRARLKGPFSWRQWQPTCKTRKQKSVLTNKSPFWLISLGKCWNNTTRQVSNTFFCTLGQPSTFLFEISIQYKMKSSFQMNVK